MSVANGQVANQDTFNNAFMSRTQDTSTAGRVDLENGNPASGGTIANVQRELNAVASWLGKATGTAYDSKPAFTSTTVVNANDDVQTAIGKLDAHAGAINAYFAEWQALEINSVSGSTFDASAAFTGKTSGGGASAVGVVTSAPNNRCEIRTKDTGLFIEDAQGQKVYARVTYSASVWTLSFFTNEAGTETAHTLSSQNIAVYFREVFTANTRPTFPADIGAMGSLDLTSEVLDASATQRGAVSTGTQSFAGAKTFGGNVTLQAALELQNATDATDAAISALSSAKAIIKLTGATTARDVQGIAGGADGRMIAVHNKTAFVYTLKHESGSATAANRMTLPGASDIALQAAQSAVFFYDGDSSRWRLFALCGGGGSSRGTGTFTGTSITPTADSDQSWTYNGSSAQSFSTTGFGTLTSLTNGTRITVYGTDNDNTLTIAESDITNGRIMNGDCVLSRGKSITFEYNSTLSRMVEVCRN